MPMGDEVVSMPQKGSQIRARRRLGSNAEDSIVLFNINNPVTRAEGNVEAFARVENFGRPRESDYPR